MTRIDTFKLCILSLTAFMAAGCASVKKDTVRPAPSAQEELPAGKEVIDLMGIRHYLGMDRAKESLGYDEKKFNSCNAGNGYSRTQNCRDRYFASVHLRLQCRDSMGTTSNVHHQLTPLVSNKVRWDWSGMGNHTASDREGYAQVYLISSTSPRKERLRITINGKFLSMTAEDMSRVVTPSDWCGR